MRQPTYRFRYRIAPQVPRTRLLPKHSPFSAARNVLCITQPGNARTGRSPLPSMPLPRPAGHTPQTRTCRCTCRMRLGEHAAAGRRPTRRNYLCVAATIRFPWRTNGANAGSGQASSREPYGGLDTLLPAMRKEIDKSDLHGHRGSCQTDHETKTMRYPSG